MTVPEKVLELVERFDSDIKKYKHYNEEDIKIEFINPLLETLGWDIGNKNKKPPNQREVRFEYTIKSEGRTQRPDYSFWLDRERKFYLDAKAPSVNIEGGINPAFQVKCYAWSSNLPLVIVTDFEEFAIYDCRTEPFKFDKPQKSRLKIIKYHEYEQRWDEIASLFSKEAVLKGSLTSIPPLKGKKVDEALLEDISEWRKALAVNIAKMNPSLDQKSLNHAVQMTIDRILFLRICEDRSIEDDGRLKKLLDGDGIYHRLFDLFEEADKRYNSGLFHFHAEEDRTNFDTITPLIDIEDEVLKKIIQGLYFPDSPYVFSEIPAEILGQVYEQFLGKVIQLDEYRKVDVVEKPEVRKAGGVYYTPSYIVDYIVKNTVGKLLEGKDPRAASELRILDPACGSGSFLIGAYQYLLDWHLNWYKSNLVPLWTSGYKLTSKEVQNLLPAPIEKPGKNARARSKRIWERASMATLPIEQRAEEWHLRTAERKRILLNNIYGVDIDTQAVEVTKLSLLLKVLEGENKASIADLTMYSDERALPDLGNNIKCGNSLIGWNILQDMPDLSQEELWRINPFDWRDGFHDVFARGGFDAVIGNPPYISVEITTKDITEFYLNSYESAYGRINTFALFIEKALKLLIKDEGNCGLITSNRILTNTQLASLRKRMLQCSRIENILVFKQMVFKGASVDTTVITLNKCQPTTESKINIWYDIIDLGQEDLQKNMITQSLLLKNDYYIINVRQKHDLDGILQKMEAKSEHLDIFCEVKDGIILGTIKDLFLSREVLDDRYKKWLEGNEVSRYSINWDGRYICYDNSLISEELKRKKLIAEKKALNDLDFNKLSRSGIWLRTPRIFNQEKILTRQNARKLIGVLDREGFFVKNSLHCILTKDKTYDLRYILGIINSRLMDSYFQNKIGNTGELFSQMKIAYIKNLPIRKIDFSNSNDVICHNQIASLVEKIMDLQRKFASTMTEHEKTMLARQIQATDEQIDSLVYELYGLNKEEIIIVESQAP